MQNEKKLNIEYVNIDDVFMYENNAKEHTDKQIEDIVMSIRKYGMNDPIAVWKDNVIIEGHGRLLACKQLGFTEVPIIHLDSLTDEERREYMIVHNQTTMETGWDFGNLEEELKELDFSDFDFDFEFEKPNGDWFENREKFDRTRVEGNEEYNEFLDKFEQPKTTDDCYTPDNIYNAVADWVASEYKVNKSTFVRPFYPGGDYQKEKYKDGSIVVDNPPFSILAEIIDFFISKGIKFFLFAPGLATLNYVNRKNVCAICTYVSVTYENGASVSTSFVTNLGNCNEIAIASPELYKAIEQANEENEEKFHAHLPKYEFPNEVLTSAKCGYLSKYGQEMRIKRDECMFIRQLDSMKESGKGIYGNALLLSEKAAAEKAAAEKAAAEKAAAEKAAATQWPLSEREIKIVKGLGK